MRNVLLQFQFFDVGNFDALILSGSVQLFLNLLEGNQKEYEVR